MNLFSNNPFFSAEIQEKILKKTKTNEEELQKHIYDLNDVLNLYISKREPWGLCPGTAI